MPLNIGIVAAVDNLPRDWRSACHLFFTVFFFFFSFFCFILKLFYIFFPPLEVGCLWEEVFLGACHHLEAISKTIFHK